MTPRLQPEVEALLDRFRELELPPFHTLTPDEARALRQRTAGVVAADTIDVPDVHDRLIAGPAGPMPARVYAPGPTWPGTLVYFHGGGWVTGDLDTHDALCRSLTNATGLRTISVAYRLAPEHPYPAALQDAWAAVRLAAADEPGALAVGGDSAGGTLATCVAARARGTDMRIAAQLLIYPVTDLSAFDTDSYRAFADGYWLTARAMEWFRDHYVPAGVDRRHSDLSPLYRDSLGGMPPAVVVTAECDVLRDEGAAYAECLREAGADVHYRCYEGMIHGFMAMPGVLPGGAQAIRDAGDALRQAMAPSGGPGDG